MEFRKGALTKEFCYILDCHTEEFKYENVDFRIEAKLLKGAHVEKYINLDFEEKTKH